ncbi:MAG: hypothetical protein HYR96_00125 [Deltaproteobacteria bacterium]|nr:hypothetical protein [Deltaproteobacteria bacterium]MBI3295949.1 hypothetical protein [Deltaproteobacteria bacterium]
MLKLSRLVPLLALLGCTQPAIKKYSDMLDPLVGLATKKEITRLLGQPVSCQNDMNYEVCEFRTSRARNNPVPAVHQKHPGMGPDLTPYEQFDDLSLQFDALETLRGWRPLRVN